VIDLATAPHTEADLERVKMALAEVAPKAIVLLRGDRILFDGATVDDQTFRRAWAITGMPSCCDACFTRAINGKACDAWSLPPFIEDCGRDR
jgi:hypothetical protein